MVSRRKGGEALANELVRIVQLHDASTVAAVIVEPVAGSAGVLPPPKGYLKRLRQICDEHDILLIFDEVITAFGRLGKRTGAEYFGVYAGYDHFCERGRPVARCLWAGWLCAMRFDSCFLGGGRR